MEFIKYKEIKKAINKRYIRYGGFPIDFMEIFFSVCLFLLSLIAILILFTTFIENPLSLTIFCGLILLIIIILNTKINGKEKDIDWFKKKYIKNKKNLEYFINQLSPSDMEKIIKISFKRLGFNWNEDGFFDEDSLKKVSSIWDAIDEMDYKEEE